MDDPQAKKPTSVSDILHTIESFAEEVEGKFHGILGSLGQLKDDLHQIGALKDLVRAAEGLLEGDLNYKIDVEAKGEVGKLFNAINTTLHNLQQLDQSVHKESERVPELASHLDIITQETETATQQVLEKLDLMLEVSDRQTSAVEALQGSSRDRLQIDRDFNEHIQNFLLRLEHETDRDTVLQESLEFVALMGQESKRYLQKSETIHASIEEISSFSAQLQDHAFEIMNHLQFQDITRQKVGKVIGLLKEMQEGLMKLLSIFNIHGEVEAHTLELTDDHRATQDNILNRDATTDGREIIDVDAIIAGFKKNQ